MTLSNSKKQYTILCIEDEADIRMEIMNELERSGFHVLSASGGEEALTILISSKPDLILCDVLMPGFGGLELFQRIRKGLPHLISTPFMFLSALANRSHVLEGLKLGADDYLTKPIDFEILETKIIGTLDRVDRTKRVAHSVTNNGLVKLTKRECQVLVEFAHGHTNIEVAEILGLSEHTIGDHAKAIFKKLQVTSRAHAVLEGIAMGLIKT